MPKYRPLTRPVIRLAFGPALQEVSTFGLLGLLASWGVAEIALLLQGV